MGVLVIPRFEHPKMVVLTEANELKQTLKSPPNEAGGYALDLAVSKKLHDLIWQPFKGLLIAFWEYLPNLFSILVIIVMMRYFIKFINYIFLEIKAEKLKIYGFYPDWAMPTYNIIRFSIAF